MQRTRIKLCGMMRPEDASLAVRYGADAIGMIFHPPSRRNISLDVARQIVAKLDAFVTPVGVFVDADNTTILKTASTVGLRTIQLSGHEPPKQAEELAERGLSFIKAVRVDASLAATLATWRAVFPSLQRAFHGILLETAASPLPGGSGVANDWNAVAEYVKQGAFAGLPPIIAAGGLNAETVDEVVKRIRPYAVDVSSGVEAAVGVKAEEKIAAFVSAVQGRN